MSTKFPELINDDKNKKWKIWVKGNVIYRAHGMLNKDYYNDAVEREVKAKAHTTDIEQAKLEAKRFWIKKLEDGYKPVHTDKKGMKMYNEIMATKKKQGGNIHGASTKGKGGLKHELVGVVETNKVVFAMLAEKFQEKKDHIIWTEEDFKNMPTRKGWKFMDARKGIFVQPKLDGIRCLVYLENGKVVCMSRKGKQFVFLTKQKEHLEKMLKKIEKKHPGAVLDGEWYRHNLEIDDVKYSGDVAFSKFITSCCRSNLKKPNKNEDMVQFHVFDIITKPMFQKDRIKLLREIFNEYKGDVIFRVPVKVAYKEQDLYDIHDYYYEQGYEGIMLRGPYGYYEGHKTRRSMNLMKYKQFEDAEYEIVGAKCASGTRKGCVTWICKNEEGTEFKCEMNATIEENREYYKNYKDYVGKMLTVRYQALNENDVPRFGRGIVIRDYE